MLECWSAPFCPEGAEELSPGFTLGFWFNAGGPEGAPAKEASRNISRNAGGPFRAKRLFPLTQGKPWAKFFSPFGAGPFGPGETRT